MGKIFYLMGKSSTGKDTIFKRILSDHRMNLKTIVTYTTRPIREGEEEGREYHFIDDKRVEELDAEGKIVELRAYNTCLGVWKYMTVDDGEIDLEKNSYLVIGTPEAYQKCIKHFGKSSIVPIMIVLDDGERLTRALEREKRQDKPKYDEMCRRFLADAADFSEEVLSNISGGKTFENNDLEQCVSEIEEFILSESCR